MLTACVFAALAASTASPAPWASVYDFGMKTVRFQLTQLKWDVVSAVVLIGLSFVPGVAQQGLELATSPGRPLNLLGICLIVIQGGSVAILRRWPQWSLALTFAAFSAYQLLGFPTTFAALGLLVALVGAGALLQRYRMLTSMLVLGGYAALVAALIPLDAALTVFDALTFGALLAALWIFGSWLRSQAAMRRSRTESAERETITAERARIAHELHDVVTHHVTAMVVQVEAGQFRPNLDQGTMELLASIADGGRTTLEDLRSLLGALDGKAEITRAPAVQQVSEVIARACSAGQQVEFVERGEARPLTGATALVVVRVVQESLTNAMRHAHDGAAAVEIAYGQHEIMVEVVSSGRSRKNTASISGARGIIGMRERVELVGGTLQAEPVGQRFVVRVRIPW
ncbi:histidine kinase [Glutamicibacter arilaitensis]|uniref:sensor histidine kinase n=1 Tax=Glutamicibacter arilaitensis TaxID=256701 RepID=UPI00384E6EAE